MTVIEVWVLTQRCAITCMLAFQQEEDTVNIFGKVILVSLVGEAIGQGPRNKNLMISETACFLLRQTSQCTQSFPGCGASAFLVIHCRVPMLIPPIMLICEVNSMYMPVQGLHNITTGWKCSQMVLGG